ncbi:hypothetical protein ADQ41_25745, partial [Salmonella enterica subsp. enterica serovar Dublin]|nr:hypothetical protein [Salmonella enterica subsp. enterica serovar Dublin]
MTALSGVIAQAGKASWSPYLTEDLDTFAFYTQPCTGMPQQHMAAKAVVSQLPVSTAPRSLQAAYAGGYVFDFYDRIHI